MSIPKPVAPGLRSSQCLCTCSCTSGTETPFASAHLVKDRDPGSSEQLHRSGERSPGRSASLTCLGQEQPQVIGVGEALFPRPSDPLAKGGDDKGQSPLVLGQMGGPVAVGGTSSVRHSVVEFARRNAWDAAAILLVSVLFTGWLMLVAHLAKPILEARPF